MELFTMEYHISVVNPNQSKCRLHSIHFRLLSAKLLFKRRFSYTHSLETTNNSLHLVQPDNISANIDL